MKHQNHYLSRCLWLLLPLLAAWPGSLILGQQPAGPRPIEKRKAVSYAFVSPNTRENLTLPDAIAGLSSQAEQRLIAEARLVACRLRLAARVQKAVGSWSDGAENSTLLRVRTNAASVRYASALLGKFARQKAVLYFRRSSLGGGRMYVLLVPRQRRTLAALAAELDADGVANRTLVPQRRQLAIYIVDLQNELQAKVFVAAHRLRAHLATQRGDGEFIGNDHDRDKAQAIFEQEIMKYETSNPRRRRGCRRSVSINFTHPLPQVVLTGAVRRPC